MYWPTLSSKSTMSWWLSYCLAKSSGVLPRYSVTIEQSESWHTHTNQTREEMDSVKKQWLCNHFISIHTVTSTATVPAIHPCHREDLTLLLPTPICYCINPLFKEHVWEIWVHVYVHHKDIHSTVTQQYQPPSDTCTRARPSRGVVQGAGSRMGRVWKVYVHVWFKLC